MPLTLGSCTCQHEAEWCSARSRAQALNIPTKINRGTVEIVSDVALISKGDKVGGSEATLLAKLGIKPFSYGLVVQQARARRARGGQPGFRTARPCPWSDCGT